jgi:hypothetical protein
MTMHPQPSAKDAQFKDRLAVHESFTWLQKISFRIFRSRKIETALAEFNTMQSRMSKSENCWFSLVMHLHFCLCGKMVLERESGEWFDARTMVNKARDNYNGSRVAN